MEKNKIDDLKKCLNNFSNNTIIIHQNGFIGSTYSIKKLKYFIEYDILNIVDESSENNIKINLNQIYKTENKENEIKLYLDSDITITLKLKR